MSSSVDRECGLSGWWGTGCPVVTGEPERMTRRDLWRHKLDRRGNQRAAETHRHRRATVRVEGDPQEAEGHRMKRERQRQTVT